jgi:hypothetical protein
MNGMVELKEPDGSTNGGQTTASKPFRIERSELNVQLSFASPFWPLANNIAALYAGLLTHMRDFGVTSYRIRPDSADGSLGAFNVNFWMLDYGVIVRIRLDGVELNSQNFAVDADQLERAFRALDQSLREALHELTYSGYVVTVGMHGRVEGMEAREFLDTFTRNAPMGLGKSMGSGAVFYFEGSPPATLLSVSADLSAVVAGGVFVKVHGVYDESMKPEGLRASAEQQLEQSIKALGLAVASP